MNTPTPKQREFDAYDSANNHTITDVIKVIRKTCPGSHLTDQLIANIESLRTLPPLPSIPSHTNIECQTINGIRSLIATTKTQLSPDALHDLAFHLLSNITAGVVTACTILDFCTKYALTQGILTMEVTPCPSDPGMVKPMVKPKDNRCIYLHNPDWHHTLDEAKTRVRTMIQNERQRIQRKLDHLTQLEQSLGD